MFVIRVEYLNDFVTGSPADRSRLEYPPNPDRLFTAFVATAGKTRIYDGSEQGYIQKLLHPVYRAALRWLEAQHPPVIYAPEEPHFPGVMRSFVPVNFTVFNQLKDEEKSGEDKNKKVDVFVLPPAASNARRRGIRLRAFGTVTRPIYYVWENDPPEEYAEALGELAKDISYLGTTWSPVAVRVVPEVDVPYRDGPVFRPDSSGMPGKKVHLRVPYPGRLEQLDREFERVIEFMRRLAEGNGRVREIPMRTSVGVRHFPYRLIRSEPRPGVMMARFRLIRKIPAVWAGMLAEAVHARLARAANGMNDRFPGFDVEGYVTGRRDFVRKPHAGIIPLMNVGNRYADGSILGFALLFPDVEGVTPEILSAVLNAFIIEIVRDEIYLDPENIRVPGITGLGTFRPGVEPLDDAPLPVTSRTRADDRYAFHPARWARAARTWTSVTPVILPQFPKKTLPPETIIARHLEELGLPPTVSIAYGRSGLLTGVPSVHEFRAHATRYVESMWTHLTVTFDREVEGPLTVGRGLHFGYGLLAPLTDGRKDENGNRPDA